MPRFVVLRHTLPADSSRPSHWDLMLEDGAVLKTWALLTLPAPGEAVPCEELPDHRRAYLDYEGPVSGNRGEVKRWDEGVFEWISRDPAAIRVRLQGGHWRGAATLRRTDARKWELVLEDAPSAREDDRPPR